MPLYVIATPIGEIGDLSPRAREILSRVNLVIGEEAKPARRLLSAAQLEQRPLELLNEHSDPSELQRLVDLCRHQEVALVADCGTPGFCDPGADLVAACRTHGISVRSVPGPSSLMAFISVLGRRLEQFVFWGFLPREPQARVQNLKSLAQERRPVFLIETPYRLGRLLEELHVHLPQHHLILGLELSTGSEQILEGHAEQLKALVAGKKAEFLLFIEPLKASTASQKAGTKPQRSLHRD